MSELVRQVLLDDEQIRIDHLRRGGEASALAVTFDPLQYLAHQPPFGQEFLAKRGLDVIAVRKKTENFYQPLSRDDFTAAIAPAAAHYPRVVAYGSSLGAYAALYFCRDLPWTVIASSPRVSAHPVFGTDPWRQRIEFRHERFSPASGTGCAPTIFFDPREPIDRRYLEAEVLPQFAQAQVVRLPFAGHPANQFLADIGFIAPFVRAVLAGNTPPRLDRRAQRARSATYFQVLALLCVQRGHVAWAESLVQRSLALAPNRMLANRTLGLVRLAQRRWDEALAALETALGSDPQDPYTLALVEQAKAGSQPPRAAHASGRAFDAWRRIWRRWCQRIGVEEP